MYFDEDTWAAGNGDNYDSSGKLYRADFVGNIQNYITGTGQLHNFSSPTYVADLLTGAWYSTYHTAFPNGGVISEKPRSDTYFSPEALAGQGIR